MKNTIRCCISCILPCGALDVIRIVHSNGRVEEISGSIRAAEIMRLHPKHVLKKPSSPNYSDDDQKGRLCPKIVILPPDAELQRGKIYFLMPAPPSNSSSSGKTRTKSSSSASRRKKKLQAEAGHVNSNSNGNSNNNSNSNNNDGSSLTNFLLSDQYLTEILSEKVSTQRDRRRGRVGVWRPHLESISETPILDG